MFLYARLVLDYLSKNIFFSGKEMKESIDELPVELTELYVYFSGVQLRLTLTHQVIAKFSSRYSYNWMQGQ